ncbi:MAG: tRNA (guanosine(46)-N7)-methyltransferase TrmB [Planctomycetes bacterium]|nr:tRNA (guanosine(46)-N7)-methyltransferase TrmB [Planctomycetota bacterium]
MTATPDLSAVTLDQLPRDSGQRFDFAAIFGNTNPVELELGIGKGRFLIQQAEERPGVNFVGVEWANKYFVLVAERAAKRGLRNLRVMRADAGHVVRENVRDGAISVLHVYFPDPWPKLRHQKRRLIQAPFAREAARVLQDGGLVKLATDHVEYAVQMEQVFGADPDFEPVSRAVGEAAPVGVTNWEVKFRAEGRTIHKFEYRRRPRRGP